ILLLSNKAVPFALLLLAPITINILLFHGVLAPAGLALPIIILLLQVYLASTHKAVYKPLFK
ncbi:MAG: DoxX protein, partial [Bdellovibrionaceae bacterium]|nr:DoxX protein [Pseudobdellovibrionaceae bacterium]